VTLLKLVSQTVHSKSGNKLKTEIFLALEVSKK